MWFQKKTPPSQALSIQAEKEDFIQFIHTTALPKFCDGRYGFADELQKIFLFTDAEHDQREIAACFSERLQSFTVKELLRMAEATRRFYWEDYYYTSNWKAWRETFCNARHRCEDFPFLTAQTYVGMLCMGTFHSNGYYRQMCLEALRDCGLGLYSERYGVELSPLIFYLLRVNDWVEEVRNLAFELSVTELAKADGMNLILALPVLEKLLASSRWESGWAEVLEENFAHQLKTKLTQSELARLSGLDIQTRNAFYRLCAKEQIFTKEQLLSKEQLDFLLAREQTGYGKRLLFGALAERYGLTEADLDRYLESGHAEVRLAALNYKYNHCQCFWQGLDQMLLDHSVRIRFLARFILIKHEKRDILAFYKEQLRKEASPICLLCVGEMGSEAELELIEPYLACQDTRLVKAALQAYAKIRRENGEQVYWNFLTGDEMVLSYAAYKVIREYHVQYEEKQLYVSFQRHRGEKKEAFFLNLLLRGNSWKRLEYLLELIDDPNLPEEYKAEILRACANRNMYARLDQGSVDRIKNVLERKQEMLPRNLVEEILLDLKFAVK